jgi:hypothetical protein
VDRGPDHLLLSVLSLLQKIASILGKYGPIEQYGAEGKKVGQ